jgi:hypothetical protein
LNVCLSGGNIENIRDKNGIQMVHRGEREMNRKQKIIIGIGLALILLSGLFPVYEQPFGEVFKKYLGYYFIFSPPVFANIIISRYLIQIVTISLLTIGFVFLFAAPKKDKNGK